MKKIKLLCPLIAIIPTATIGLTNISCSNSNENKYSEKDIDTTKSFDLRFNELKGEDLTFGEARDLYYDLAVQHPEVIIDSFRYQRYCFWKTQDLTNVKETFSVENLTVKKVVDTFDTYLQLDFDFEINSKASNVECKLPFLGDLDATKWDFHSKMHIEKAWFRLVPYNGTYTFILNIETDYPSRSNGLVIYAQTNGSVNLVDDGEEEKYTFINEKIKVTEYGVDTSFYELLPLAMLFIYVEPNPYFNKISCIKFITMDDDFEKQVHISAASSPIEWHSKFDDFVYSPNYAVYQISVQSSSLYLDCDIDDSDECIRVFVYAKDEQIDVGDTISFDLSISIFYSGNMSCGSINIIKGFKITIVED